MIKQDASYRGLSVVRTGDQVKLAKEIIALEASGKQTGLYSRFSRLNRGVLKYFRFGMFNLLAGRSGSGKSLILNMLRNDFSSGLIQLGNKSWITPDLGTLNVKKDDGTIFYPESRITEMTNGDYVILPLNSNCIYDVVVLNFGFEMKPTDELIRSAGTILGRPYAYLLSAEYNKTKYNGYNSLSAAEQKEVEMILDCLGTRKEYYAALSGDLTEMQATVDAVVEANPNCKIVITLDHDMLVKKGIDSSTENLIANLAHFAITNQQRYDAMLIYLHQLNNEIEQPNRIHNREMHYPSKIDIHYGSQLWWAADNVMVLHVPRLLRIDRYGPKKLHTQELAHLALIKSRFGTVGNVWLKEQFAKGRLIQSHIEAFANSPNFNPKKRRPIKIG